MADLSPKLQIPLFEAWKLAKLLDTYQIQSSNPELIAQASAQIRSDVFKLMESIDDETISKKLDGNQ